VIAKMDGHGDHVKKGTDDEGSGKLVEELFQLRNEVL
jgi:hypothetical protein